MSDPKMPLSSKRRPGHPRPAAEPSTYTRLKQSDVARTMGSSATMGQFAPRPCVLLAEDNADTREMYSEYLAWAGYRVVTADNGRLAIEKANEEPPSIVLVDISMPVMDGWATIRALRANPKTANVPIIVVTAHISDQERAEAADCAGFLVKPCLPEVLEQAVTMTLARRRSSPSPSSPKRR